MIEAQPTVQVTPETLVEETRKLRAQGYRLVQINATRLGEVIELNYSFDLGLKFQNLRLQQPKGAARVPSVSPVYWCAFAYENELHDLFGVEVEGNVLDFKGTFYKTAVPQPFVNDALPAPVSKK
jgi:ech hydrogenase subunit D